MIVLGGVPLISQVFVMVVRGADDPLGPVDQDPDGPRDIACDLTASDTACTPPQVEIDPPDLDPPDFDLDAASTAGSMAGTLLVVFLVAALVAAIAWLVATAIKNRSDFDDDDIDDLDETLEDEAREDRIVDIERPPDRWRRAAAEHREAGRFRDAIRCQYRALVGDLARAGIVDEIPGRTSGEERDQLAGLAPDVSPSFDVAADTFDEAWFNDDEVTAEHDGRFRSAEQVVLDHVMAGTKGRTKDRSAAPTLRGRQQ